VKIVFHYAAGPGLAAKLAALGAEGLEVAVCPEDDDARFTTLMRDADVIWHVLKPLTGPMIAAAPKLRLIQKIGVGVNTIDLEAAAARGIPVCNLPGANSQAVAEMTLLLMLATLRRLPELDRATRDGRGWLLDPGGQDQWGELAGRTVGLVGYGAIPRLLTPVLAGLGCRVLYTCRKAKRDAIGDWLPLDALLDAADILSLHVPLTPETEGMIGRAALARLRPGTILINTARGGLVDQDALTEALSTGRLSAAGLDVFAHEPVDHRASLFALRNVVVTPHVAWASTGTFARSVALAAENCRRLTAGDGLLYRVR
jgi:phosphoglycerate dehydrogenase-like enzyme